MQYLKRFSYTASAVPAVLTLNLCAETSADVNALVERMSLEQKIDFIGGYESFNIRGYAEWGIPEIHMADGPVGIRAHGASMAYPASINLAATWDKDLAYATGKAIGSEARSKNIHMMLGPGMNIYRMPACGRNFEYLGEDPYLAGQQAVAYIHGMQNEGVIACAKHFAANNQEFERHHCSSDMDERTLHEIYLPAFKASVIEGSVGSVMTSYNLINGVHASQNAYLIQDVLKGEWGFEGFAVSDWVSTYDGLACAQNGLDLEMPSAEMMNGDTILSALENGTLEESVLDDKIRRILGVYERFGLLEHPDISQGYTLDNEFVSETALQAAREGIVLLKNEGQLLPLKADEIHTIAVIGPNGSPAITGGGGSSLVEPSAPVSVVDAICKLAGNGIKVTYNPGVFGETILPAGIFEGANFYYYENGAQTPGVEAVYYAGKELGGEAIGRKVYPNLNLRDTEIWGAELPGKDISARYQCCFTPETSGNYVIGVSGDDGYRLFVDGEQVLEEWRNQSEREAKYEAYLEAGREYRLELEYYQAGGGAAIRMGAMQKPKGMSKEEYLQEALAAAKAADIVVLAVGFNPQTEGEGFDRSYELPYGQGQLIEAVAQVNPNCVVVLNAGGNVAMESWIDGCKGLLHAWYPGAIGNEAVAEILFGKTNPSGKLPVSLAYTMEDNPCYTSYFDADNDLKVFYREGIFVGYRYWDESETTPRFPFGYGLSYTHFDYSTLQTDKADYAIGEPVEISLTVSNSGAVDGAEVVEIYVGDTESSLPRPVKELKGYARVELKSGEEKTVHVTLAPEAFAFYNPETHAWETEPGDFVIYAAASSQDIREQKVIHLK